MEFAKEIAPYLLILALLIAAIGIFYDAINKRDKILEEERKIRDLLIEEVNQKLAFHSGIRISFETFNDKEAIAITYFDEHRTKRHTEYIFATHTEGDPKLLPYWMP